MNIVGKVSTPRTYLDLLEESSFYTVKEANDSILGSAIIELEVMSEAWKSREAIAMEAPQVSMQYSIKKVERQTNGVMDSIANFIRKVIQFLSDIGSKFGQMLEEFKKDADYVNSHITDLKNIMDPPDDVYRKIQENTTITFIAYYKNDDCMRRLRDTNFPDGQSIQKAKDMIDNGSAINDKSVDFKKIFPELGKLGEAPRDMALAYYRGESPDQPRQAESVSGAQIKEALQRMITFTTQEYAQYHSAAENMRKRFETDIKNVNNKLKELGAKATEINNTEVKKPAEQQQQNQQGQTKESFMGFSPEYSILEEAKVPSQDDIRFVNNSKSDGDKKAAIDMKVDAQPQEDRAEYRKALEDATINNQQNQQNNPAPQGQSTRQGNTPNQNNPQQQDQDNQTPKITNTTGQSVPVRNATDEDKAYDAMLDKYAKNVKTTDFSGIDSSKMTNAEKQALRDLENYKNNPGTAQLKYRAKNGSPVGVSGEKKPEEKNQFETQQAKETAQNENSEDQDKARKLLTVIQGFQSVVTAKMTVMEEVEKEYMRVLRGVINGLSNTNTQLERTRSNREYNQRQEDKEQQKHDRAMRQTRRQGEQAVATATAARKAKAASQQGLGGWWNRLFS